MLHKMLPVLVLAALLGVMTYAVNSSSLNFNPQEKAAGLFTNYTTCTPGTTQRCTVNGDSGKRTCDSKGKWGSCVLSCVRYGGTCGFEGASCCNKDCNLRTGTCGGYVPTPPPNCAKTGATCGVEGVVCCKGCNLGSFKCN